MKALLDVRAIYDEEKLGITLEISNQTSSAAAVKIFNSYTGKSLHEVVEPRESVSGRWSLIRMWGWYDLTITVDGDGSFKYQLAGHVENTQDSISDPIMAGLI